MDNDFERMRVALAGSIPDRVPLGEGWVKPSVKAAFLGRPIEGINDEVDFWIAAGYDYVSLSADVWATRELRAASRKSMSSEYGLYAAQETIEWADEEGGVIRSEEDFERFPWPAAEELDLSVFEQVGRILPDRMRVIATTGSIFTTIWTLMGFEPFCMAVAMGDSLLDRMYDRVGTIVCDVIRRVLSFDRVGAVWFPDDLAYSGGLMVSPDHYRRKLFPWFGQIIEACQRQQIPVIYHTDGNVLPVMDDIVELGFSALQPIEPKAMDIREVKRRYGKNICLIGNVDLNYTLTRGTPAEVEEEVRGLVRDVAPGGGFCIGSGNSIPSYVPIENYRAMLRAAQRYGRYPICL